MEWSTAWGQEEKRNKQNWKVCIRQCHRKTDSLENIRNNSIVTMQWEWNLSEKWSQVKSTERQTQHFDWADWLESKFLFPFSPLMERKLMVKSKWMSISIEIKLRGNTRDKKEQREKTRSRFAWIITIIMIIIGVMLGKTGIVVT